MDHAVDPADPLALHKLVFLNKVHTLKQLLAPYKTTSLHSKEPVPTNGKDNGPQQNEIADKDTTSSFHPAINSFDHRLQTPLHLAVMLNRKDIVLILLEAGANPVSRSGSGWTPRQEATSLGDRQLIEILTRHQRKAFSGSFETKAMKLVKQLSTVSHCHPTKHDSVTPSLIFPWLVHMHIIFLLGTAFRITFCLFLEACHLVSFDLMALVAHDHCCSHEQP
jgi:hypothetical protein